MAKSGRYATLVHMLTLCRLLMAGWTETHVLAERLAVDRVTVLRYLATLRAAGLEVERREEDSGRAAYRLTRAAWRAWGEG